MVSRNRLELARAETLESRSTVRRYEAITTASAGGSGTWCSGLAT